VLNRHQCRPKRRSNLSRLLLAAVPLLWPHGATPLRADEVHAGSYFTANILTLDDGRQIEEAIINGPPRPPPGFDIERQSVALPEPDVAAGINRLTAPAYNWVFGCSAVSGAMIAAYYDRSGWANIYTGPTNGGVMPLNNGGWPTWSDGYETYPNCPLIASKNGVDGRTSRGSIDDYWIQYGSEAADPYVTNGWTQHAWGDAIGDYMKTSQSDYGNTDGSTAFYNWTSLTTPLTCGDMEDYNISYRDGTYGRKLFYEARGYRVAECYNQKTDNNGGGFTFAMYQAEIDAGRPVLLNLQGHSIVGVGYDSASSTVYLHDTWDYNSHTMTWGTSYSGMTLLSVSVVNLDPCGPGIAFPSSAVGQWQQLALPCAPSGTATVAGVFGNAPTANFAAAGYASQWLMQKRDPAASSNTTLIAASPLAPNAGYWIKSTQTPLNGVLKVTGTHSPLVQGLTGCQSSAGCAVVPVYASGQPLGARPIGNPLPYDVDWSKVRVRVNGIDIHTPSEARTANLLSNQIWTAAGGSYSTVSDTLPAQGVLPYFRSVMVKVLPGAAGKTLELLLPASPSALVAPTPGTGEWVVRLSVGNVAGGLQATAALGHWAGRQQGYDSGDLSALTPFASPYLTIAFPHTDWGDNKGDYAVDLRPADGSAGQWAIDLRANPMGSQVVLTWQGSAAVLARSRLLDGATVVNLADYPSGYPLTLSGKTRRLVWEYLGD